MSYLFEMWKVNREIKKRAKAMAADHIKKELQFRAMQSSDFTYEIMSDMVKAARLAGRVEIKFKDGTTVNVIDTETEARKALDVADTTLQQKTYF